MMGIEERRVEGFIVLGISVISLLLWGSLGKVGAADESGLENECNDDFQSVMTCLSFAQGKIEKPSKECCSSVSSVKEKDPKCLCYIIEQSQTAGAKSLKSLGVQQAKLLQLPSACQLKNASISNCPQLLGLAPNSPDAAIFTNASSIATTPASASSGTPSSASEKSDGNSGRTKLEITHLVGSTLLITSATVLYALPAGLASPF